jgi:hypothetical protein
MMVWPLAKLQLSVHEEIAVVPVFLIVRAAPNPPGHWFVMA